MIKCGIITSPKSYISVQKKSRYVRKIKQMFSHLRDEKNMIMYILMKVK